MKHLESRRVLIFEPDPRGHRLYYVRLLVNELVSYGAHVHVLTSTDSTSSQQWRMHLGDSESFTVHTTNEHLQLSDLSRFALQIDVSHTIIPDGDRFLLPVLKGGWRADSKLAILAMRPESQRSSSVASLAWGIAKKSLILIANTVRNVRASALRSPLQKRRFPIRWVQDPITLRATGEDVERAQAELKLAGDVFWVGVFGAITLRKNLDVIAEAVARLQGVGLLVAGSVDSEAELAARDALDDLRRLERPVHIISNELDDRRFDALLVTVDCVVAAHSNEGPSGIVGKSFAANKPLVLAGARSLAQDAQTIGELARWSEIDPAAIADNVEHFRSSITQDQPRQIKPSSFLGELL